MCTRCPGSDLDAIFFFTAEQFLEPTSSAGANELAAAPRRKCIHKCVEHCLVVLVVLCDVDLDALRQEHREEKLELHDSRSHIGLRVASRRVSGAALYVSSADGQDSARSSTARALRSRPGMNREEEGGDEDDEDGEVREEGEDD